MKNRVLVLLALTFTLVAGASAQQQPSASHRQAVEELLKVMNISKALDQSREVMIKSQIAANPQLAPVEDVMRQFMTKYLSWEAVKPGMVQMYAETFTEPEVRELTTFYRTPLGQKTVTKMPELFQKSAALGQKVLQEHLPELQAAIAKKMKENQGAAGKKP